MVLADPPRSVTDRLQLVLNVAERCRLALARCGRLVRYELAITLHLHDEAPKYQADCCVAVSDAAGRHRLHSAHRRQLDIQRCQRNTLGRWTFSIAGPTVWNSLPGHLSKENEGTFRQSLKQCFGQYYCAQCITVFTTIE